MICIGLVVGRKKHRESFLVWRAINIKHDPSLWQRHLGLGLKRSCLGPGLFGKWGTLLGCKTYRPKNSAMKKIVF